MIQTLIFYEARISDHYFKFKLTVFEILNSYYLHLSQAAVQFLISCFRSTFFVVNLFPLILEFDCFVLKQVITYFIFADFSFISMYWLLLILIYNILLKFD
jgi:hypothetical protein